METESVFNVLLILLQYIKQSDREEALFAVLDELIECDVDLISLSQEAEHNEEDWMVKIIKRYIKENGLDEEDEEEEW